MSVRMILLSIFAHIALVFVLLLSESATDADRPRGDLRWRSEIDIAVPFYLLTICAWNTQFADLLFIVLAWIFVALRIVGATGASVLDLRPSQTFMASAILLAAMWIIYALRLLFAF
jgi:hypothetical protein